MKTFVKLLIIYIVAVLAYGILAAHFTIPVHLGVDEELYISMARSFHYDGVFSREGQILNYSCVLYSILLSLAYFFYRPEHIMFAMRMIGVLIMLSSIVPIYLLSKAVLGGEGKKPIRIAAFACLLPSMMDTAYCLQEVLGYPLFLWLIYEVYIEIKQNKVNDISGRMMLITVLAVLCYFTKTYMIFFPVIYCMFMLMNSFLEKKYVWKKLILFMGVYLGLYFVCKEMILYINNGIAGTNHYAVHFSELFPITSKTIVSAVSYIVFYIIALTFYVGVLPIVLPLFNHKEYDANDRKFLYFVAGALLVLVAEVVISIVLVEESNALMPRKFYWRYFQIFEVPLLLLFLKKYRDMKIPAWLWTIYVVVFGYLGIYYVYIGNRQKTAIVDAPIFLLMENINRYIIPYFNVLACLGSAFIVLLAFLLKRMNKISSIPGCFAQISGAFIVLFMLINVFQLPYYTNVIAGGSVIEKDAVKLVNYWDEHQELFDKVYFVESKQYRYERSIYAYFPVEVYNISIDEIDAVENNSLIIMPKEDELPIGVTDLNFTTELFRTGGVIWETYSLRK